MIRLVPVVALLSAVAPLGARAQEQTSAGELYQQARDAFDAGEYERAAGLLEAVHTLNPDPLIVFNIGRAWFEAGQCEQATSAFRRYLELDPDGDQAARASAQLEQCESAEEPRDAANDSAAAPVAEDPPATAPMPAPPSSASPWPYVVGGVGLLTGAVGALLAGLAVDASNGVPMAANHESATMKLQAAHDFETGAYVSWAVGGALVVAGVVLLIVDHLD